MTCFHTRRREKEQFRGSRAEASSTVAGIHTFKHFFHPQENDPIGGTYLFRWIETMYKNVPDMKERGLRVYTSTEINDQNKWHSLHNCCFKVVFLPPILMTNMFSEGGFQPSLTDSFFKQRLHGYWACCLKRALLQCGKAKNRLKFSYIIPSRGDFSRFFSGITSMVLIKPMQVKVFQIQHWRNINNQTPSTHGQFRSLNNLETSMNGLILWF